MHLCDEPFRFTVSETKKHKVSMILMGSQGRAGLTRLMMGSTVSRVIGHAPYRVMVAPVKRKKELVENKRRWKSKYL